MDRVQARLKEETANEDSSDRLAGGEGGGPGATVGEGEGADPGARRDGRTTPAHAVDGRGEGLPRRRAGGARGVLRRRPASTSARSAGGGRGGPPGSRTGTPASTRGGSTTTRAAGAPRPRALAELTPAPVLPPGDSRWPVDPRATPHTG